MTTVSEEWLDDLIDNVVSEVQETGFFDQVNEHEPKSKPDMGLTAAVWPQEIRAIRTSGLNSASARVEMAIRLYSNMLQEPLDMLERNMLKAVSSLLRKFNADFDFQNTIRNIDILGAHGEELNGAAGYLEIDGVVYRVYTLTVPCIVNDVWTYS